MAVGTFHYTARSLDGSIVRGSLQAADTASVVDVLRSRALCVTAVDRESDIGGTLRRALRIGAIPQAGLLTFVRAFVTLMRAGVSIARALSITIERADHPLLREALCAMLADIEHGLALSDAMVRHPRVFPPIYVAMVRAGEAGGILDDVLERLALLLERQTALRAKLRTALAYPAIILVAASMLIVFLIASIVPMFAQLFASNHVELPWSTKVLLEVGVLLREPLPWLLLVTVAAASAFALLRLGQTSAGARSIDALRLRMPIVGPLVRAAITARVARMLGTLLRSGIELATAIEAIVPVAGSPTFAQAFQRVNDAIRDGESLSEPLGAARLFDPMFLALVRVGEETGLLDVMLLKLAEYFERDVDAAIATLGTLVEPAIIGVLGGVVGLIVCSIFVPLYSLIGSVSP